MELKKRYSDEELEEFRQIINEKLKVARQSYNEAMQDLSNANSNTDADTAPTYKILEEGTEVIGRENLVQKAQREYKFIQSLEADHVIPSIKTIDGDGAASFDVNEKFVSGRYAGILEWDSSADKFKNALGEGRELVVGEEFKDLGNGNNTGVFSKISMLYAISANSKHPKEAAMLMNFLLNDPEGIEIIGTQRGIPSSKVALSQLEAANAIDEMTGEAHKKVLEAKEFNMSTKFDDSSLKGSSALYTDVFGGVSYGDYTSDAAAKMLFDGFKNVSN